MNRTRFNLVAQGICLTLAVALFGLSAYNLAHAQEAPEQSSAIPSMPTPPPTLVIADDNDAFEPLVTSAFSATSKQIAKNGQRIEDLTNVHLCGTATIDPKTAWFKIGSETTVITAFVNDFVVGHKIISISDGTVVLDSGTLVQASPDQCNPPAPLGATSSTAGNTNQASNQNSNQNQQQQYTQTDQSSNQNTFVPLPRYGSLPSPSPTPVQNPNYGQLYGQPAPTDNPYPYVRPPATPLP